MNERKRLPRCIDDGYDNVGSEIDPEFAKWLDRACTIAAGILIVFLLAVEWK